MVTELKEPKRDERVPELRRPPARRVAIWGPLLVVLVLALALIGGIWRHIQERRQQEDFAQKTSQVSAEFVVVKPNDKPVEFVLPGNIQAFEEATLYARTNGYIGKWLVDIGDKVKEGQLLAEIETPEVDQELAQARDTLKQTQADYEFAKVSAERWQQLVDRKVVAKQDNDQRQSAYQASSATFSANKANVARLEQIQGFKRVVAPFAGVITSRKIDVGALVSAGSGNAGTALFSIAKTDPVDVYVSVPQSQAPLVQDNLPVEILVQEYPGREFKGAVSRTAGALDPQARTLLVQVQIPNSDNVLLSGMYAQVKFQIKNPNGPLIIPANAFVFRSEGAQVATLDDQNRIHWQSIEIGRDFGTRMEVVKGLSENARVVMNPTDDLREGLVVVPKSEEEAKGSPASGSGA